MRAWCVCGVCVLCVRARPCVVSEGGWLAPVFLSSDHSATPSPLCQWRKTWKTFVMNTYIQNLQSLSTKTATSIVHVNMKETALYVKGMM